MKISVLVSVADMLVLIYLYRYRQKYRLEEYICIGICIGSTHIGPTLKSTTIHLGERTNKPALRSHLARKPTSCHCCILQPGLQHNLSTRGLVAGIPIPQE